MRLTQGKADQEKRYYDDPLIPAREFAEAGAQWIHVVDLDGAFAGNAVNMQLVQQICSLGVPVELGGGIRSMEALDNAFSAGVARAIIGTRAVEDPAFVREAVSVYGQRIAVGIDARGGKVATAGWVEVSTVDALDFAAQMADIGVGAIIYTDISTDGMLTGPNFTAQEALLKKVTCPVIASGGVAELDDLRQFAAMARSYSHLEGVIVGKALYEGRFNVADALRLLAN